MAADSGATPRRCRGTLTARHTAWQKNLSLRPSLPHPGVKHRPFEKRIELWRQLVNTCEAFLLAGLRSLIGPEGDFEAAYRDWYTRHMDEHDQGQIQLLEKLSRREQRYVK